MKFLVAMWLVIGGSEAAAIAVFNNGVDNDVLRIYGMFSLMGMIIGLFVTAVALYSRHRRGGAVREAREDLAQ